MVHVFLLLLKMIFCSNLRSIIYDTLSLYYNYDTFVKHIIIVDASLREYVCAESQSDKQTVRIIKALAINLAQTVVYANVKAVNNTVLSKIVMSWIRSSCLSGLVVSS